MDCKRALEAADGVIEEAAKLLAQKGLALASKKAGRTADQGVVDFYVHSGGRLGAMIEVNCETDFVARTDQFKALAHDLAMQVAAMEPDYRPVRTKSLGTYPRPAEEVALLFPGLHQGPPPSPFRTSSTRPSDSSEKTSRSAASPGSRSVSDPCRQPQVSPPTHKNQRRGPCRQSGCWHRQ